MNVTKVFQALEYVTKVLQALKIVTKEKTAGVLQALETVTEFLDQTAGELHQALETVAKQQTAGELQALETVTKEQTAGELQALDTVTKEDEELALLIAQEDRKFGAQQIVGQLQAQLQALQTVTKQIAFDSANFGPNFKERTCKTCRLAKLVALASDRPESIENFTKEQVLRELQLLQIASGHITGKLLTIITTATQAFQSAMEQSFQIAESIETLTKGQTAGELQALQTAETARDLVSDDRQCSPLKKRQRGEGGDAVMPSASSLPSFGLE